ncbi:MAG: flavodoxin family protein [Chloroflexota bacterium]
MKTVSIIYHSGTGHTQKTAESVAKGASIENVSVNLLPILLKQIVNGRWEDAETLATLAGSDAIIFGSPTYMGMVSGPFKCFADATAPIWFNMSWKNKIAGGFTSSGYASGDKVMTLHYLATLAAQLRMIWVGPAAPPSNITQDGQGIDSYGFYLGVGVVGNQQLENQPDAGDLLTAELYGSRIAEITTRWQ